MKENLNHAVIPEDQIELHNNNSTKQPENVAQSTLKNSNDFNNECTENELEQDSNRLLEKNITEPDAMKVENPDNTYQDLSTCSLVKPALKKGCVKKNEIWYAKKYASRFLAVEAAYFLIFIEYDHVDNLMDYLHEVKVIIGFDSLDNAFLNQIVTRMYEIFHDLDEVISPYLNEKWSLNRLNLLGLSVIKAAICELLSCDTPGNVVINEYVKISTSILDESEIGFINAILDKIQSIRVTDTAIISQKEPLIPIVIL